MAKKDVSVREENDRSVEPAHAGTHDDKQCPAPEETGGFTQVKNAHAAGLGAMGRNDEKLDEKDEG